MRQSIEIVEATDFCNWKADLFLARADVYRMASDEDEVVLSTRRAAELYRIKGNIAGLELIKPRLEALSGRA